MQLQSHFDVFSMFTGLLIYCELTPSLQENKIEYIEADEIETEMDDMEDFEGLLKGEDSSISYVLGPVVAVKKLYVTLIILNSSNRLGLLKYVVRYGL